MKKVVLSVVVALFAAGCLGTGSALADSCKKGCTDLYEACKGKCQKPDKTFDSGCLRKCNVDANDCANDCTNKK